MTIRWSLIGGVNGASHSASTACQAATCLSVILMFCGCGEETASQTVSASAGNVVADPPELKILADRTETVEASVVLRNDGSAPVELLQMRTSCPCLAASSTWKPLLDPGESTVVSFGARPMSYGVRQTSLNVTTDSVIQPEIVIPIEIKAPPLEPPYVRFAPSDLHHRVQPRSTNRTFEFAILCVESRQEAGWFLGCESTLECVTFSSPKIVDEDLLDDDAVLREYRITAEVNVSQEQAERQSGRVILLLASPSMRPVPQIPLHLTNEPAVRCMPAALLVRSSKSVYTIVVRSEDNVPFRVGHITEDNSLAVEIDSVYEGATHVLRVHTDFPRTTDECCLKFTTTHPDCDTVTLTVVFEPESSG